MLPYNTVLKPHLLLIAVIANMLTLKLGESWKEMCKYLSELASTFALAVFTPRGDFLSLASFQWLHSLVLWVHTAPFWTTHFKSKKVNVMAGKLGLSRMLDLLELMLLSCKWMLNSTSEAGTTAVRTNRNPDCWALPGSHLGIVTWDLQFVLRERRDSNAQVNVLCFTLKYTLNSLPLLLEAAEPCTYHFISDSCCVVALRTPPVVPLQDGFYWPSILHPWECHSEKVCQWGWKGRKWIQL